MNASQRIGDLQMWRRPKREAAGHVGAGGSGPGRVWHPGWPRHGAVVPAESGTQAGPIRGQWSRPSLAPRLAPSRGGGPCRVWHPGWLHQGAVVPAESGTPAGSVRRRWSWPSLASWLALSPLWELSAGCASPAPTSSEGAALLGPLAPVTVPSPCLAESREDISPGAEGP